MKDGKVVMKEWIVKDTLNNKYVQELARCKDCIYYHGKNEECGAMSFYPPSGDWYCAEGKRKDDNARQGEDNQRT